MTPLPGYYNIQQHILGGNYPSQQIISSYPLEQVGLVGNGGVAQFSPGAYSSHQQVDSGVASRSSYEASIPAGNLQPMLRSYMGQKITAFSKQVTPRQRISPYSVRQNFVALAIALIACREYVFVALEQEATSRRTEHATNNKNIAKINVCLDP